ncbi:tripartite tricarboxylate transporter TctB family protein [Candidatus Pelagibacter sp.]|nr:tripartite tricarboxylate transporter TctB family protein [Candidatus Pelagibacter sp.]
MNINTTKIISLLFFIFSVFYLYTAYQIQVFTFDENAPFNAKTFPIYLGYAGMFFSGLKVILPESNTIRVDHKNLEYKKTGILILIAIIYGATILKVGYFLTTSLFLASSYYFLGERRWFLIFILSFPFVAGFMYLLHGVLEIYLRDPFLKYIGVMG